MTSILHLRVYVRYILYRISIKIHGMVQKEKKEQVCVKRCNKDKNKREFQDIKYHFTWSYIIYQRIFFLASSTLRFVCRIITNWNIETIIQQYVIADFKNHVILLKFIVYHQCARMCMFKVQYPLIGRYQIAPSTMLKKSSK